MSVALEAVVIALACLSPWAFGAVGLEYEFALDCGVALLLALWAVRMALAARLPWRNCPVTLCLAGLFLLGVWQTVPVPCSVLRGTSPATAQFYDRLLPAEAELIGPAAGTMSGTTYRPLVPSGRSWSAAEAHAAAGRTISLYRQATRRMLLRVLAVLALFAAVRNNLPPAGALRRLSLAMVVNGALLSLFGLVQFCTSPSNTLYWHIVSEGGVFGPFVDRDHFAFYINLCIGLGLGLLLSLRESRPQLRNGGFAALLAHPESLWILAALALMLCGELFTLSRGGFVALVGAAAVCAVLARRHALHGGTIGVAAAVAAAATAGAVLSAYAPSLTRLSTLGSGATWWNERLFLVSGAWPIIKSFPIWGTGYGTFRYIEPLYLHTVRDVGWSYEYAHNEYLEGLIEGGVVRLGLTVAAMALVFRCGLRALAAQRGKAAAGLALGAVFSFTTVAIHSLGEFGLHIPAITFLSTVIAALLCGLSEAEGGSGAGAVRHWRWWGIARTRYSGSAAGIAVCVLLGILLVLAGWGQARVETARNRLVALAGDTPPLLERRVECLEFALGLAPDDADLHADLAQAHLGLYDLIRSDGKTGSADQRRSLQQHYQKALQHFLLARDLCPLLPVPHVRIAANRDGLSRGDDRDAYLARAKFLAPADPRLWYFCGLQELADGNDEEAWKSWRRSLVLSDRFLGSIVDRSMAKLGGDGMLRELLPDKPAVLLSAALHVYPRGDDAVRRRPLLEKALALLDDRGGSLSVEEWSLKADLCTRLNKPAEAIDAWRAALALHPLETGWRFELARLLYQQQRSAEAIGELRLVLDREPNHAAARELSATMAREAAEGKLDHSP